MRCRNRQRVFDVARELFAVPDGDPSMEQIARAAGVGVGTMYRNWPSRSALVEAIYREDLAGLTARAAHHRDEQEPWDALVLWLRDYLAHAQAKRGMLTEFGAAFDARPELLTESRRQVLDATALVLEPAQRAGVGARRPDRGRSRATRAGNRSLRDRPARSLRVLARRRARRHPRHSWSSRSAR